MATRQCFYLVSWLASAATACSEMGVPTPPDGEDDGGSTADDGTEYQEDDGGDDGGAPITDVAPNWGRLASPGYDRKPIIGTLFFPGQARDGLQYYEYRPSSNLELYTEQPLDRDTNLNWSSEPTTRTPVLQQMAGAGVNVVFLSNWGPPGSNAWSRWAPMQSAVESHDEVVKTIVDSNGSLPLLVVPFLESNPEWGFRSDFILRSNGRVEAPVLVTRIVELVRRTLQRPTGDDSFGEDAPTAAEWTDRWAQIYDSKGRARFAIAIIHASSDSRIDDQKYVDGLDGVAAQVEEQTGVPIGFLLDALPPGVRAPGRFFPTPAKTAEPMKRSSSVLGISSFLPEIWSGITTDPGDQMRLAWKRNFTRGWVESEVPTLVDVSPGYDASVVFPNSVIYGRTPAWRDALTQLVADYGEDGVVLNSWNGYTEGMSTVPTEEHGSAVLDWATTLSAIVTP